MEDLHRNPDPNFRPWYWDAIGSERSYEVGKHRWTVREVIDPVTLTRVLVFTSDGVGRRVRHYPTGWRELPTAELDELSWST